MYDSGAEHVKMTCRRLGSKSGEAARPIRVELSDQENKTTVLKKRQTPEGEADLTLAHPDATRRTERIEKKKEGNVGRAGTERRNGDN